MAKMIGRSCPTGPGGRDCICCGQSPGINRKRQKRSRKHSEKQSWKREARMGY